MPLSTLDVLLRLLAAAGVGVALGLNRDLAAKPIGMRTLALVAMGGAAAMLAALQMAAMQGHPDALSRVVQGVIQGVLTGVGFVGAGVVLHQPARNRVRGLTTAATVWLGAALGLACGLGAWAVAGIGVALALLVLAGLHPIERRIERAARRRKKAARARDALRAPPRADK
ncbi:MAG: MgtC/SapB family protein [Hyphomonadaceae bacterium]